MHPTTSTMLRPGFTRSAHALLAAVAVTVFCAVLPAHSQIYISNQNSQTLGEYDLNTGNSIKSPLVTGLSNPAGVALGTSNNFVYVVNNGVATVNRYNATSGAAVKFTGSGTNTITGFTNPMGLTFATVASGGTNTATLFVGDNNTTAGMGAVSKYSPTTGALIPFTDGTTSMNSLSGFNTPDGLFASGNNLFVADFSLKTVSKYNATTGAAIPFTGSSGSTISLPDGPLGLTVSGGILYIASGTTVGSYNQNTGKALNASLITGLNDPEGLAVASGDLFVVDHGDGVVGEYDITQKNL